MSAAEADRLLAEVAADPWGHVTPSPYETGRLVTIAPWLAGHDERLAYLRRTQRPDGGWGGPDGYALTSTLSATAALLTEVRRAGRDGAGRDADRRDGAGPDRLEPAATAGLRALREWLAPEANLEIPDTIASELVIPALVEELNRLTAGTGPPLPLPEGFGRRSLERARAGLAAGVLAPRLAYSLEVFGPAVVASPLVRPAMGVVGLSPAATAAWLGGPSGHRDSHRFLDQVQARSGGPVPVVNPISYFEAAWVLNSLAVAGLAYGVPPVVLDRLDAGLADQGAPVAAGLPPDADDTGAVLSALLRHGRDRSPAGLLEFHADSYFRCYHGERDPSVSTNAHALEALALYLARHPEAGTHVRAPAAETTEWLLAVQNPDGSWWDKWHASPYYATAGCVLALSLHGGPGTAAAIARAVAWICDTARSDGSWGRWGGTVEETAYAVQVLAHAAPGAPVTSALTRAAAFLTSPPPVEQPPLWHGKDLYRPVAVVRAAHLSARVQAERLTAAAGQVPPQRRRLAKIGTAIEADRQP